MEFLRVLNRKSLAILIGLIILNGVLFYRECSGVETSKIYDELINTFSEVYEKENDMEKVARSVLRDYGKEHAEVEKTEEFLEAKQMFLDKVEYIKNYSKSKEEQIAYSKIALTSSLFGVTDSYSRLNIEKTRDDLIKIKDEPVTVSNGRWLEKVTDYKLVSYLILVSIFIIIYSFIADRKSGVIYIQYATSGGRSGLLLKRVAILFVTTMVVTVLMYLEISIIALMRYGGVKGIFDSVCSDEAFAMCSMGMSRVGWLVVNILRIVLGMFTMGLFIWGIMSFFNNSNIGLTLFVLIYFLEVVLNEIITGKSVFRAIKFLNIRYLVEGQDIWFAYNNWGYDKFILSNAESTYIVMLVCIIISAVLLIRNCIWINPLTRVGIVEKIFDNLYQKMMKLFAKVPICIMEFFKVLVSQRIAIVLILIFILYANINKGYLLKYNITMSDIEKMCQANIGASGNELYNIRTELLNELNSDQEMTEYAKDIYQSKLYLINYLIEKTEQGSDVELISPYGYNATFGKAQSSNQEYIALLCIIVIIMINGGAIAYENKTKSMQLILAGKNRDRWLAKKFVHNAMFTVLVMMILYGDYYYQLVKLYKLEQFNASIQSLEMFSKYPLDIPIWSFIIIDFVLKVIIAIGIGGIVMLVSSVFKYGICYFVSAIIIIPHFMYKLGIDMFSYISVPKLMALMPFWIEGKIFYNLIAEIIIVAVGIIAYIYTTYRLVKHKNVI